MKNAAKPHIFSLLPPVVPTLIVALTLLAAGCESANDPMGGNRFTMSAIYANGQAGAGALKTALPTSGSNDIDSITVNRARIVLSKLKLESDDDTVNFRTPPFVLELNLAGQVQQIAVSSVPPGAYDEVTLKIHRVDSADVAGLPSETAAQFADFLADEGYSIIIDGTVYKSGDSGGTAFTYKSAVSRRLEFDLRPPVVVSDSTPTANVTFMVRSEKWFNSDGCLIDPTDSTSQGRIDKNLASSVQVFEDDDCNGSDDHHGIADHRGGDDDDDDDEDGEKDD